MAPRTATPAPTDRSMWRRLLRQAHPDGGGDHDLFIWVRELYEHVSGDAIEPIPREQRRQPPPHPTSGDRVPYEAAFQMSSFTAVTNRALELADELPEPYARVLRLLADCFETAEYSPSLYRAQYQGASYKQLAYIAHLSRMSRAERIEWYRIAESVPLSQRHAGHILARLQRVAA
jgi:hypothetical protein